MLLVALVALAHRESPIYCQEEYIQLSQSTSPRLINTTLHSFENIYIFISYKLLSRGKLRGSDDLYIIYVTASICHYWNVECGHLVITVC